MDGKHLEDFGDLDPTTQDFALELREALVEHFSGELIQEQRAKDFLAGYMAASHAAGIIKEKENDRREN